MPRSCEEYMFWRGTGKVKPTRGRNVTIDLDGGGPMQPVDVICKIEKDENGMDTVWKIDISQKSYNNFLHSKMISRS